MSKKLKYVKLDYEKLSAYITKTGMTKEGLSFAIGRSKTFITGLKNKEAIPENLENLICTTLGAVPGTFVRNEERPVPESEIAILSNIYKEITESRRIMLEEFEKLYNKVNTNTIQLAKIKEAVSSDVKSDYDRTVDFLKKNVNAGAN